MLRKINEFFQEIDKSRQEALAELSHIDPDQFEEDIKKDQIAESIRIEKELGDMTIFFF